MKGIGTLALGLVACAAAGAQGTKDDYARADSLSQRVQGRVAHGRIEPVWLDSGSRFWYRGDLGGGRHEFLLVDPPTASRQPAFDHARLAAALSRTLGRAVAPDRLPFSSIVIGDRGSTLRFTADRKPWSVDLRTYDIHAATEGGPRTGLTPLAAIHPSRSGGEETEITVVNRTSIPLDVFWVDTDGKRVGYGALAPGATRTQHTFAGHVWLLAKTGGAAAGAFEAAATPAEAVVDATTPAPATARRSERRAPEGVLSPDGKWRGLVRGNNVVMRNLASGEERALTKDGSAEDRYEPPLAWSPDSRRLIAMKTVPAQEHKVYMVESSPSGQVQPKLQSIDYLKPGDRIAYPRPHLFDVASITAVRDIPIKNDLFPNPWEISEVRWDPDSSRFTFLYNQRGHQAIRVIAVDAGTGETRALIDEEAKTFIDWTNKVYFHPLPATSEAIWMSERDGWNHLYLYDLAAARVKNQITRGEWVVRKVDRVDPIKRQIWFEAGGIWPGQDPYYIHYCRVNFDGTGLTLLTEGDGTHDVKYSPDGSVFVDTWSRVDMPPVTEVRSAESGKQIMELERGDASSLLATGWRLPERFAAKGRDGKTEIYGVIFRPSNFDPAKKYPVLENIYAGPQGSFVPKAWSASHPSQAMAELGFIVVQIDGMGTNNRSKAFQDICWKNLADAGFPDRILWMKAAAAKHAEMDLTRVGIYGTSAGGQSALAGILEYPDVYKAAVADCGCHDNRMDKIWWNEQWMGWPVGPEYAANSNVTLAPKLRGKLLLMVGELDTNVDPASTMQVVNALVKANKDFDLFVMPGAGHGVAGTPYGRRKLRDFFVRTLLHVAPPDRNAVP